MAVLLYLGTDVSNISFSFNKLVLAQIRARRFLLSKILRI